MKTGDISQGSTSLKHISETELGMHTGMLVFIGIGLILATELPDQTLAGEGDTFVETDVELLIAIFSLNLFNDTNN